MIDVNDIVGETRNELTILKFEKRDNGKIFYKCLCSCGKECTVDRNQILTNKTKSCGHLQHLQKIDINSMIGKVYGRLTVESYDHYDKKSTQHYYNCKCICGNYKIVSRKDLKGGGVRSCGCLIKDAILNKINHNMSNTRFYKIYQHIKQRCTNPNDTAYHNYGAKGIKICDRWLESFDLFYDDMYESYIEHCKLYGEDNTTIDRIDVNGNYEQSNCKWSTRKEQANNKNTNIYVKCNNQMITLMQAYSLYALPELSYRIVYERIKAGWTVYNALTTSINTQCQHSNYLNNQSVIRPIYFILDKNSTV